MDDERPAADPPPPPADPPPPPADPAPTATPPPPPVLSWGPPPGTKAPVTWASVETPVVPPPPGTVYAGVGIRFVAWILDLIPLTILAIVLFAPVLADFITAIAEALPDRPQPDQTSYPELQAAMAAALTNATPGFVRAGALLQLGGLIYLGGSWLALSRSPAMALLGLRIVREEDGGPMNLARVAVRYGGYFLSAATLLLGFIWALFDARNQAWHDKLAGTVVVRPIPDPASRPNPWGAPAAPPAVGPATEPAPLAEAAWGAEPAIRDEPPPLVEPAATVEPAVLEHPLRRPSVGAVAEAAWATFRRAPLDLFASLAVVLIPAMIVLLPLIALYMVIGQDQAVLSFQLIGDAFNFSEDPESLRQFVEYNRRILASAAPSVTVGVVAAILGSIVSALVIGGTAAAVDDRRQIQPSATVTRALVAHLPALLWLGAAGGVVFALQVLLLGLPAITAASSDSLDPTAGAGLAALLALLITPVSLYLGAVWLLAIVAVVRENLDPVDAFRRAWQLSRGRMRWLIAISVGSALAIYAVLGPIGPLPVGLLAEEYIAGGRLPIALSVITLGLVALLATPLLALVYVEAYRAARDDAARHDAGRHVAAPPLPTA